MSLWVTLNKFVCDVMPLWHQVKWVGLAILSQLIWGGYTIIVRYLQTRVPGKLSPLVILSAALTIAFTVNLIDALRLIYQVRGLRANLQNPNSSTPHDDSSVECTLEMLPMKEPVTPAADEDADMDLGGKISTGEACAETTNELLALPLNPCPPSASVVKGVSLYSVFTCGRMTLNIIACGMTYAYFNAMVMLVQPFLIALCERAIFGQVLPPRLWPALTGTLLGSSMLIYGAYGASLSSTMDPEVGPSGLTHADIGGVILQFTSICFSTAGRLTVRGTKKLVTRHELLLAQFGFTAVILGFASCTDASTRSSWGALLRMPWDGWLSLAFLSVGVYVVGQSLNILCIRNLSATLLSSLSSLRLVVACLGSAFFLQEPLTLIQWEGSGVIIVCLMFYVHQQYVHHAKTVDKTVATSGVLTKESEEDSERDDMRPYLSEAEAMIPGNAPQTLV